MYTTEQTKELQKATTAFLKNAAKVNDIEQLRNALRLHEYRYYVLNDPLVADVEYDQLYKQLQHIEEEHPKLITKDSPTQRVGSTLNASFPTVQHLVPMLSLDNSYNAEDLYDFDRKARELTGLDKIEYCVEPKFDGASISLIYENDLFARGATRGDGVEGEDITTNLKQIKSIPLSAPFSKFGLVQVEIRGEVIITKDVFKKYNDNLITYTIGTSEKDKKAEQMPDDEKYADIIAKQYQITNKKITIDADIITVYFPLISRRSAAICQRCSEC